MKWCAIVYVLVIVYCVNESDGFKILKKIKYLLHPTVSSITAVPTLPQYEKQAYFDQEDSKSWERESIIFITKPQNMNDLSSHHSSEKDRDRYSDPKEKWNLKRDKTPPLNGDNYGSTYSGNKENQFSSHDKINNKEFQTTTKIYDQSKIGNFPGQSSFRDRFNNQEFQKITRIYDVITSNSGNYLGQYASQEGSSNQGMKSKTPTMNDFSHQDNPEKSIESFGNQITESNIPTIYENTNYNEVLLGVSPYNNNNGLAYTSISTTTLDPDRHSESSLQEGKQYKYTAGQIPPYSSTKGTNQKKSNNDGGAFVFPDNHALDSTPETKGTYSYRNPNFIRVKRFEQGVSPAPVNEEEGRYSIMERPLKKCLPEQIYDKKKNICRLLLRK